MNAAFYSFVEIFLLVKIPTFMWAYTWWGAFLVFITVYIPFILAAFYAYDWAPRTQKLFIGTLFANNAASLILFAGILRWI